MGLFNKIKSVFSKDKEKEVIIKDIERIIKW